MSRVLLLTTHVPYPVRANGITVRVNPLLVHLSSRHEVHLIAVNDPRSRAMGEYLELARGSCASAHCLAVARSKTAVRAGLLRGLLHRPLPPSSQLRPFTANLLSAARSQLDAQRFDVVFSVGPGLCHAAAVLAHEYPALRHVYDWIDAPSLLAQRKTEATGKVDVSEIEKIKSWQRSVNQRLNYAVYISEADAAHANGAPNERVAVLPNGLYDDFPNSGETTVRAPLSRLPQLTLGFLGHMGYEPNHRAAMWLATSILDAVQQKLRDLRVKVKVIGRAPRPDLMALRSDAVEITGSVPSIWPSLADVDVFVFPMEMGAGLQNKVLEAIRAGRPVVMTSVCANGLAGHGVDDFFVADTNEEIASAIETMLRSPDVVSKQLAAGEQFLRKFDWAWILPEYEALLTGASRSGFMPTRMDPASLLSSN